MPDTPDPSDKPDDDLNVNDITEADLDSISGGHSLSPVEQVLGPGQSAPPPKPPPPPPPLLFW